MTKLVSGEDVDLSNRLLPPGSGSAVIKNRNS